jgi:hypothetical protein
MTMLDHDPVIERLRAHNPAVPGDFPDIPVLGPLPAPSRTRPGTRVAAATAVGLTAAVAVVGATAFAPSSAPGGRQVIAQAFAGADNGDSILRWTTRTEQPHMPTHTDEAWLLSDATGKVTKLRELRLDGEYKGLDSAFDLPAGVGATAGASDETYRPDEGSVRRSVGYRPGLYVDLLDSLHKILSGATSAPNVHETTYEGQAAYEVLVRPAVAPRNGTSRDPGEVSITLWVGRDSKEPLAVRYGEGSDLWLTQHFLSYEREPATAENRQQLQLAPEHRTG